MIASMKHSLCREQASLVRGTFRSFRLLCVCSQTACLRVYTGGAASQWESPDALVCLLCGRRLYGGFELLLRFYLEHKPENVLKMK